MSSQPGNDEGRRPGDPARPPAAEAISIHKSFGRTIALNDVSIAVLPGECHALVGRNGAGKSTLVGVLTGLLKPDEGTVRLHGEPAPSPGDRAGWQQRVACVYQRSMVAPSLSVGENIFLNRSDGWRVRWRDLRRDAHALLLEWGFDLDVDAPASQLSVEQRQVVEIARALASGARFLILDEPTAALEANAVQRLFEHVRRVKASGVAILYISHHLEEVYEICDRATVLRDGRWIVTAPVADLGRDSLVRAMVGEDVVSTVTAARRADEVPAGRLRVTDLAVSTPLGSVEGVSFSVAAGECVGLFGLRGSGAATIADAVVGLIKPSAGVIELDGEPLRPGKVDAAVARGVGYVPEDRHARGFVPTMGVEENLTLPILRSCSRFGLVSPGRRRAAARELVERLQVVASGPEQPVAELSGGNQQKVAVGRALAGGPGLLVVVSPTVGVDIASKEALLGVVDDARERGTAVLLVSDDLDDLRICTRVMVVRRGAIVRELHDAPWDHHELTAVAEGLEVAV